MARIDSFFKFMKEQNASDLHLSTGNPPMLRIHGELVRVDMPALANDDLKALVYEIAPEVKIKTFEETATWISVTSSRPGEISREFFQSTQRHFGRLPPHSKQGSDGRRSWIAAGAEEICDAEKGVDPCHRSNRARENPPHSRR
jgi:hypothetical protein